MYLTYPVAVVALIVLVGTIGTSFFIAYLLFEFADVHGDCLASSGWVSAFRWSSMAILFCSLVPWLWDYFCGRTVRRHEEQDNGAVNDGASGADRFVEGIIHAYFDRWALNVVFRILAFVVSIIGAIGEDFTQPTSATNVVYIVFYVAPLVFHFTAGVALISKVTSGLSLKPPAQDVVLTEQELKAHYEFQLVMRKRWSRLWGIKLALGLVTAIAFATRLVPGWSESKRSRAYGFVLLAGVSLLWANFSELAALVKEYKPVVLNMLNPVDAYERFEQLHDFLDVEVFLESLWVFWGIFLSIFGYDVISTPIRILAIIMLNGGPMLYYCFVMQLTHRSFFHARQFIIHVCLYVSFWALALVGGDQVCTSDTVKDVNNFNRSAIYFARLTAMPTTLFFGLLQLSSPAARKFRVYGSSVPTIVRLPLSLTMWLSQFDAQRIHALSAIQFLCCGALHMIAWIFFIRNTHDVIDKQKTTVAIVTGAVMLILTCVLVFREQYGLTHIYLAFIVLLGYIVHGASKVLGRTPTAWVFPVLCVVLLILLHPLKREWWKAPLDWISGLLPWTKEQDSFSTRWDVTAVQGQPLNSSGSMIHVVMRAKPPVWHPDIDVADCGLMKVVTRRLEATFCKDMFDTLHYFSLLGHHKDGDSTILEFIIQDPRSREDREANKVTVASRIVDHAITGFEGTEIADHVTQLSLYGFVPSIALSAYHYGHILAFAMSSGYSAFAAMLTERAKKRFPKPSNDMVIVWTPDVGAHSSITLTDIVGQFTVNVPKVVLLTPARGDMANNVDAGLQRGEIHRRFDASEYKDEGAQEARRTLLLNFARRIIYESRKGWQAIEQGVGREHTAFDSNSDYFSRVPLVAEEEDFILPDDAHHGTDDIGARQPYSAAALYPADPRFGSRPAAAPQSPRGSSGANVGPGNRVGGGVYEHSRMADPQADFFGTMIVHLDIPWDSKEHRQFKIAMYDEFKRAFMTAFMEWTKLYNRDRDKAPQVKSIAVLFAGSHGSVAKYSEIATEVSDNELAEFKKRAKNTTKYADLQFVADA